MVQRHMEWEEDACNTDLAVTAEEQQRALLNQYKFQMQAVKMTPQQVGQQIATNFFVGLLFAYLFKTRVTDKKINSPTTVPSNPQDIANDLNLIGDGKALKYDLLACHQDCDYCFHGWFCSLCFTPDLFASNKIRESYWVIWIILMLPGLLTPLAGLFLPIQQAKAIYGVIQLFTAIYLAKCTGELREKIGGKASFGLDCIKWYFCSCCTVIQWQRQMDEIKGDRVQCFMALKDSAKAREHIGDSFGVEPLLA